MTEEYQAKTLKPTRTAPVSFKGRIIAETQWGTGKFQPGGKECWMRFRVWETRGGAYIAQISGDVPGKPDQVHCKVGVVEPILKEEQPLGEPNEQGVAHFLPKQIVRDEIAMQIAVLDFFDFHDRAKQMLKRELGWSPFITVE